MRYLRYTLEKSSGTAENGDLEDACPFQLGFWGSMLTFKGVHLVKWAGK